MKVVLGVRKSCDASIVSAKRDASLGSNRTPDECFHEESSHGSDANLETIIQSKLSASQRSKPRSRSLIWRSARKSRPTNDSADCRMI